MDYFNSHRTSSRRLRSKLALQTLANEANNELIINKNLFNEVKHIQDQIVFTKQLFSKLTNTPDSIKAVLLMQNEFLLNNNNKLKKEIQTINSKLNNKLETYFSNPTLAKINSLKEDNFILENTLNLRKYQKSKLKDEIKSISKYTIFQEPKREIILSDRTTSLVLMDSTLEDLTKILLLKLKAYNKQMNKIRKYKKEKENILKDIRLLKRKKLLMFKQKHSFSKEHTSPSKALPTPTPIKTRKIPQLTPKEELFDYDYFNNTNNSESNKIIEEELHSDEDIEFEIKTKHKKTIINDYNAHIKETIPQLDLKQIEYNKEKYKEIDMYSLQRRAKESTSIVLRERTSKVKLLRKQLKKNKFKLKAIESYISKYKEHFKSVRQVASNSSVYFSSKETQMFSDELDDYGITNVLTCFGNVETDIYSKDNNKFKLNINEVDTPIKPKDTHNIIHNYNNDKICNSA